MTNATKANLIAAVNALLGVAVLFGAPLSPEQIAGVLTAVNALAALLVGVSYKRSPKRVQ